MCNTNSLLIRFMLVCDSITYFICKILIDDISFNISWQINYEPMEITCMRITATEIYILEIWLVRNIFGNNILLQIAFTLRDEIQVLKIWSENDIVY